VAPVGDFTPRGRRTPGNHYQLSAIATSTIAVTPPRPQFDIGGTSGFTRGLVSSLTSIVNVLSGNMDNEAPPCTCAFDSLTSLLVLDGLRRDFVENEHLWSGRTTPELTRNRLHRSGIDLLRPVDLRGEPGEPGPVH